MIRIKGCKQGDHAFFTPDYSHELIVIVQRT